MSGFAPFPLVAPIKGANMQCPHRYFLVTDGVRRCTQCGKSADEVKASRIETKAPVQIWSPESRRNIGKGQKAKVGRK